MKKNGTVFLVSGTGGAGKNTLVKAMLSNSNYKFISSYTTREKRECDMPNQYSYISNNEFEKKIKSGEIFEYDMFNNKYYGTSKKLFTDGLVNAKVVLKDISVLGLTNIKEALSNELNIVSVFLTEKKSVLKERMINRGDSLEKIKNRLTLYKQEQAQIPNYNYVIKNSNYQKTLDIMNKIAKVSLNNELILPTKDVTKLSAKKIDAYATKLEKGKNLKPVLVTLYQNKLYLIEGVHRFLASLKTGKNVVKQFVDEKPRNKEINSDEWKRIIKAYTA